VNGTCEVVIATASDVDVACRSAAALATTCNFSQRSEAELVLIVSELAHNVLRHAGHGRLVFERQYDEHRQSFVVTAEDNGPGIADVENALEDGSSSDGGLGAGLGAVQRLSDRLEIRTDDTGTVITAWKWTT
jgi:serine/threonine-protein kinase RsbT